MNQLIILVVTLAFSQAELVFDTTTISQLSQESILGSDDASQENSVPETGTSLPEDLSNLETKDVLKVSERSYEVNSEESATVSSELSQNSQVVPVTEKYTEDKTDETNLGVAPNTEKTDKPVESSEKSQSYSVQTELYPTLSSSLQESSTSLVSEVPHLSTEQTKTTPVAVELLGSTVASSSEKSDQLKHSTIPDPSSHVTVVNMVPSVDQNATIVHQENIRQMDGSYKNDFETSNGILFHEEGVPRNYNKTDVKSGNPVQNIVVKGAFAWTAPDGQKIAIKYYADETGYHPEGNVLPTPPPTPPEILRALALIRKLQAGKKEKELKSKDEHLES